MTIQNMHTETNKISISRGCFALGVSRSDFDKNVRNFARFFNLKIVELQGSKKIAEQSYQNAKKFP